MSHINDMNDMKREVKKTANKAKYMAKEVAEDVKDNFEELEGKEVKVAGRLMSKRGQGKVVFADLADLAGKIQLFIKIDNVGEEALKEFKTFDLGF